MKENRRGEIWLGEINSKKRPLLIINNSVAAEIDRTVLTITSNQKRNKYDVPLKYWKQAGLDKPSVVRCSKINTIVYMDLIFKIGEMHKDDFENVLSAVKDYIGIE